MWITIGLLMMGIAALFSVIMWLDRKEANAEDEVAFLYQQIWTGHEYDRIHAWRRVIAHIEITDKWHLYDEAHRRLRIETDARLSDSYVNVNGKPVLHREVV